MCILGIYQQLKMAFEITLLCTIQGYNSWFKKKILNEKNSGEKYKWKAKKKKKEL